MFHLNYLTLSPNLEIFDVDNKERSAGVSPALLFTVLNGTFSQVSIAREWRGDGDMVHIAIIMGIALSASIITMKCG
jgi:hypothetical protein